MTISFSPYFDFIKETAYQAGKLTLEYFQTGIKPDMKADNSPVTIADKKTEEFIRLRIEEKFPGHMIVGEEFGESENETSSHRWYIDPIDGTKSFVRGIPFYTVLIGLEIEGVVRAGAAYSPALDEMVAAATNEGCWWNGREAHVSEVSKLSQGNVVFGDVRNFRKYKREGAWERIKQSAYLISAFGDAYGHILVATGRAELMLDPIMSDWDCGPFPVILSEAGGYFGDWQGKSTIHAKEAISTTKTLLPEVLQLIGGKDC